jgi:hypothetical protein
MDKISRIEEKKTESRRNSRKRREKTAKSEKKWQSRRNYRKNVGFGDRQCQFPTVPL